MPNNELPTKRRATASAWLTKDQRRTRYLNKRERRNAWLFKVTHGRRGRLPVVGTGRGIFPRSLRAQVVGESA